MQDTSDDHILTLIRKNESQSYGFSLLVKKYQQRVYWLVRNLLIDHEDTNDVVQDVFVLVWKNAGKFNGSSGLYTWIYRIAANEALSFIRKKKKRNMFFVTEPDRKQMESLKSDPYFRGNEIQLKLQKAVLSLPRKQQMVFTMKYFGALKYEEIAESTGTSVGALKASYHIAVKKIEKMLTGD